MSHAPRFHRLAVNDVRRESTDAVSLTFAIPSELTGDYSFVPGQYLTLRTTMDGPSANSPHLSRLRGRSHRIERCDAGGGSLHSAV